MTPTYFYIQSPMTPRRDPDSKIPIDRERERERKKRLPEREPPPRHSTLSSLTHFCSITKTHYTSPFVSHHREPFFFIYIACVMTSPPPDWLTPRPGTVRVAQKKTVSSDCLFRGNQAHINCALLTLPELLRQVLMTAGFWSAVSGADHLHSLRPFAPY